jgi:hypothetical protein
LFGPVVDGRHNRIVRDNDLSEMCRMEATLAQRPSTKKKGSRNDLRAFVQQLEQHGITCTPAFASIQHYNDIISTTMERGFAA